ncbi:MAG: FAD-dependent oxidoreductase [Polyangiales bacterium]
MESVDVVVVGAGLSGLAAARRLVDGGATVRVLEARERVGGRTLSEPLAGGVIDLGGQWIGPTQDRVAALARELGVATFPQHQVGKKVLEHAGVVSHYTGLIPKLPLLHLLELDFTMRRLDWLSRRVPPEAPWRARKAAEWDASTLADWQRDHISSRGAKTMIDIATRAVFAAEPTELSFLYFLAYLASGGGLMRLIEVRNGAQQDRFVGGAQRLSVGLAARLGDRVTLGAPVRALEQSDDGVIVRIGGGGDGSGGERTVRAKHAILALPPAVAGKIHVTPALPARRALLGEKMPMGSAIKVVVAYASAFWRQAGFAGEAVSDRGPMSMIFDDCAADGSHPALVGFVLGDAARVHRADPDARKAAVLAQLVRTFGPRAATPLAYVDKDWSAEEWTAGCYVGLMAPGVMRAHGEALRAPCGRIHFAGTEAARQWMGYLDGAIESGERAASEVLSRR